MHQRRQPHMHGPLFCPTARKPLMRRAQQSRVFSNFPSSNLSSLRACPGVSSGHAPQPSRKNTTARCRHSWLMRSCAAALERPHGSFEPSQVQVFCAAGFLEHSTTNCSAPQASSTLPMLAALRRRLLWILTPRCSAPQASSNTPPPGALRRRLPQPLLLLAALRRRLPRPLWLPAAFAPQASSDPPTPSLLYAHQAALCVLIGPPWTDEYDYELLDQGLLPRRLPPRSHARDAVRRRAPRLLGCLISACRPRTRCVSAGRAPRVLGGSISALCCSHLPCGAASVARCAPPACLWRHAWRETGALRAYTSVYD